MGDGATLMVLLSATLWGSSGLFVSYLSAAGLSSVQLTATRLVFAAITAGLVAAIRRARREQGERRRPVYRRGIPWLVLNGGVGIFAFSLLYSISIELCGMAVAAVLIYLMPSIVTVYEAAREHVRPTMVMVVCLVLSLASCALVSGILSGFRSVPIVGVACGLAAALAYATNNIVQAGPLRSYPETTVVAASIGIAAVLSVAYALAFDNLTAAIAVYVTRPDALFVNVLFGLTCSVVTFLLYNAALRRIPASRAAIFATFEPVAAALSGTVVLGNMPDVATLVGIVCEVSSLLLMRLVPQQPFRS